MKTNHLYLLSLECCFNEHQNPINVWTIRKDSNGITARTTRTRCYISPTPASAARVARAQVEIIKRQIVSIDQI